MVPPGGTEITILMVRAASGRAAIMRNHKTKAETGKQRRPDSVMHERPPFGSCDLLGQQRSAEFASVNATGSGRRERYAAFSTKLNSRTRSLSSFAPMSSRMS